MTLTKFKHRPVYLPNFIDEVFNHTPFRFAGTEQRHVVPAVNIKENEHAFVIELAAPGLQKEHFKVHLEKDVLKISATKQENTEEAQDEKYTRREFNYASFERSFTLPETANSEGVGAKYENGVLSIVINKKNQDDVVAKRAITIE